MTTLAPLTPHQQQVLDTLRKADGPLSAYGLLDRLRGAGFAAPTQVYRALDKLMARGLVHRLETLNAYVPCSQAHEHEHGLTVFAICDDCGRIDEMVDRALVRSLDRLAKRRDFSPGSSTIEIHGRCAACKPPP